MNEQEKPISSSKKNIAGELILPFCALLFTLYYFSTVIESPWTAQVNAFMVGSVLIGVVVIFFITRIVMLIHGKAQFHLNVPRILSSIKTRQSGFIGSHHCISFGHRVDRFYLNNSSILLGLDASSRLWQSPSCKGCPCRFHGFGGLRYLHSWLRNTAS